MISQTEKKPPESGGVVCYKSKRLKRGLFKRLFGTEPDKVTIIVPGEDVASVEIIAEPKAIGGEVYGNLF